MSIDLEEIINRGYLYPEESRKWSQKEHHTVLDLLSNQQLPEKFAWGYLEELAGLEQLEYFISLYNKQVLPSEKGKELDNTLKHYIHFFRLALELGIDYAADKQLLEEWLAIYTQHQTGDFITKKQRLKFLDATQQLMDEAFLEEQSKAVLEKANAKKTYKFTHKEVEALLLGAGAGRLEQLLINDKKTKEFWAVNTRGEVWYFDGQQFGEDPFQLKVDKTIPAIQQQLAQAAIPCSERLFFWTSKKSIHLLKFYGEIAVLYFSNYYPQRDEALFTEVAYCKVSEKQKVDLTKKIKNYTTHTTDYFDKRVGLLLPVYQEKYFLGYSIYQKDYVTIERGKGTLNILKSYSSHEEALQDFEQVEMKLIKEGHYLYKVNTFNDL